MSGSTTLDVKSVALGAFDGIHIAHQALIKRADAVVVIEKGAVLTPGNTRCKYVDKPCFFYKLNTIRHLDAKGFVSVLKKDFPHLQKIVVGYDFAFGKDRKYSIADLKRYFDGEVEVVAEVQIDGVSVHSRVIKELLKKGEIYRANRLLGRCYQIEGKHVQGLGIGSKELVPTINLDVQGFLLPKEGVYATLTNNVSSVTFIGKRESIDGSFSVETHILGKVCDWKEVCVCFVKFLRENKKFSDLAALKVQIEADIKEAKEILNENFSDPHFHHFCRCR